MGKAIAIMSPKGGVGKTFLATALGLALDRLGFHTLIMDTNLFTSNVSLYLGMPHLPTTFNDVIKFGLPETSAIYHFSNSLDVLPSTTHLETDDLSLNPEQFRKTLFDLKRKYQFIILDTETGFTKNNTAIVTSVDEILLIATPDIPTLMTTHKKVIHLKKKYITKVDLVINMSRNAYYELKNDEAEELMGIKVIARVPYDKGVVKFISLRKPTKRGKAYKVISQLAEQLSNR